MQGPARPTKAGWLAEVSHVLVARWAPDVIHRRLAVTDILDWLGSYSGPVLILIVLGAGFLFVARTVVERGVDAGISTRAEKWRLELGRRSEFEERVLTDRYVAFQDLFARLQGISTTLNRIAHGQAPPDGFFVDLASGREVVPLTAVFDDLSTREPILGSRLHSALQGTAQAALTLANRAGESQGWESAKAALLAAAEHEFGLSKIKWDKVSG